MKISTLKISETLTFSFTGPPLSAGPLPAAFYFALSSKDSFETDPYNQPALFLNSDQLRIFTTTIPGHEKNLKPENAITLWAEKIKEGDDILTPFFQDVKKGIDYLKRENLTANKKLGAMGLSRGVFIACHVAALCPDIRFILGFAPLTCLSTAKEFQTNPNASSFDLKHLIPNLYDRTIRFYIGNQDTRVGTENAFQLIHALATRASTHRIRSSPLELIIGTSIGYQGHGTTPNVFQDGAIWLEAMMLK